MNIICFNIKNTTHQITTIVSSYGDGIEKCSPSYRVLSRRLYDRLSWTLYFNALEGKKRVWKRLVNAVSMFSKQGFLSLTFIIYIFDNVSIPKAFSFNLFSGLWKNNRKCSWQRYYEDLSYKRRISSACYKN